MLTGELPFRGENAQAVIHSILKSSPKAASTFRRDISFKLERIIEKALAKDAGRRFQSIDQFRAELEMERERLRSGAGPERLAGPRRFARKRSVRYAALATVAIAALAIGTVAYQARASAIDSVAVLPFTNLSGDRDQEYFSDGMTEALINELGQIGALTVISRTSVMRYKDTEKTLPEIARELNVDAVVEASVMRNGDRVQIRAQLVRARPEKQLWAESYTTRMKDVLSLHAEVAHAIAGRINTALTPREESVLSRARVVDPEAYDRYLRARHAQGKWTQDETAIRYFKEAIDIDPTYADPYLGLAGVYGNMAIFGTMPFGEARALAEAAVAKAVELDPSLEGLALGIVTGLKWQAWNWDGIDEDYRRAIALNPNDVGLREGYDMYLTCMGRYEDAIQQSRKEVELAPLSPGPALHQAWVYYYAGRFDDCLRTVRKILQTTPRSDANTWSFAFLQAGWAQAAKGMHAEAAASADSAVAHAEDPAADYLLSQAGTIYAKSRQIEKARTFLNRLLKRSGADFVDPFFIAQVYDGLDELDPMFEWLEKAYAAHSTSMVSLDADFGHRRHDPRYQALRKKVGFPQT
jgi:TolB-like protein